MTKLRFYRDRDGRPGIQAESDFFVPADFLESDIQDSETGRETLAMLMGPDSEQESVGNSYVLSINGKEAVLENQFDDSQPVFTLPSRQLVILLNAWIEFLDQDNLLSLVPDF